MLYLIVSFVVGLVIATIINRKFPRTLIKEVEVITNDENGIFITNEEFLSLIDDLCIRIPHSVIHINHNKVLFVTPTTGKVWSLSLNEGWTEVTADYRKAGAPTRRQVESMYQEPPMETYIQ